MLVAQDVAPSGALKQLSDKLIEGGYNVSSFLAGGRSISTSTDTLVRQVVGCHAVVIGMSSSEELAVNEYAVAQKAIQLRIPVFSYMDTFGMRPHFGDVLRSPFTTLFHLNLDEVRKAKGAYPNLRVIATGNPMWEKFFFPTSTRAQVRLRLGVDDYRELILVPGGKDRTVNEFHFRKVMDDVSSLAGIHLIISLHPGDTTDAGAYQSILSKYTVQGSIIPNSEISGSDIVPGADLVYGSASTVEIEAVCQRIPVIDYLSKQARERLKKNTGSDIWDLVRQGVVHDRDDFMDQVTFTDDTYMHILQLLYIGDPLLSRCGQLFPKPERLGLALDMMIKAIKESIG